MTKNWKKTGYLLPEVLEPEDNICVCVPVPKDWGHVNAFLGQISELGKWLTWEKDGTDGALLAARRWIPIIQCVLDEVNCAMANNCGCGSQGEPTNQRYTSDGHLEVSYDGGETWENGDAIDPRFNSPVFPPIPGDDGTEKRCSAANSALAVIEQAQQDASSALGGANIFANLVAAIVGLLAATGIGIVAGVVVGLMGAILVAVASAGKEAFDDSFTETIWDELFCSLFCNMEADGSFTEAGWQQIIQECLSLENYPANEWLSYIIKVMSPVGLTNAARSGNVGLRDCDTCPCDNTWCYNFDFSASDGDWAQITTGGYLNGSWPGAPGWVTTDHINTVQDPDTADRLIYIHIPLPARTVTKVTLEYDYTGGTYDTTTLRALFVALNGVDRGNVTRAAMVNGTHLIFEIEGTWGGTTDIAIFLRPSRDTSSPYSYSGSAILRRAQIEGEGDNPFGADNCE